ncbi:GNAT family N-acetyltransferase [Paenibacillus sp. HN-1]|uniref:GNAT family N-acetyltransferase n=1 Tax=Paenibacillus TaxID=44249 RepID=UPI001CAA05FE|nr:MULTISPECIES: GNAT family N-acetyltransferase [Paenibacillus]MBY9080014.1 GNAT family N-acetyltransferase [Paenibacillus sp. CGMCC 1.18879]MBY9086712.1 GNAT family N-acetyltransferase [Paenibacillus sinensis]
MEMVIRSALQSDAAAIAELIGQLNGRQPSVHDMELRLDFIDMSRVEELIVCEKAREPEIGGLESSGIRENAVSADGSEERVLLGCMGFRLRENIEDLTRYGEVSMLVTNQAYRRQGVGRKLMEFAERMAKERGCIGTWLVSGTSREEAHRFYREMGYEITGYRFIKRAEEKP